MVQCHSIAEEKYIQPGLEILHGERAGGFLANELLQSPVAAHWPCRVDLAQPHKLPLGSCG